MTTFLRIGLPLYFLLYFGIAFVAKTIVVSKRIGKNPLVLPKDDSAYGLIGLYFKRIMIAIFVYVITYALFPACHNSLLPALWLQYIGVHYLGLAFLFVSLVWTVIAQGYMKNSWRIGIDTDTKTELITNGLFAISRNPIFLGMILTLVGLFLTIPNVLTCLFMVLGYVIIQIQIRLEEEFLIKQHGLKYSDYKQKVRRLI